MVVKLGCSLVIKEYSSFWMLFDGLKMWEFSKWKFINLCWSVSIGFGHSSNFPIKLIVHCVEFSTIS